MAILSREKFGEGPSLRELIAEERRVRQAREEEEGPRYRSQEDYAVLVPEPKVGTLDLNEFPFQREPLYSDAIAEAEEVVIKKATQTGVTTGLWRWILRRVDQYGETGIYYFPTDNHVTDFGDERIDPAIQQSPYLQRRMTGVNHKHMKQFGAGTLYLRGVKSITAVQSVPADCIVFDEYDEADQRNIKHAERRLSGARAAGRVPRTRRIGRPTVPGYGIAAAYDRSDQRVWMVTCPKCGLEQELTFAENLRWRTAAGGGKVLRAGDDEYEQPGDVVEAWRACRSCDTSLEPLRRGKPSPIHDGYWKVTAEGPGRVPGYHITRFIVPWTDLAAIVVASRETRPYEIETFHNADLGLEFAAADAALDEYVIRRACAAGGLPQESNRTRHPKTMGIDVASERALSVRISEHRPDGRRYAIYIGEIEDDGGNRGRTAFEKLEDLMRRYEVDMAAIDALPERRSARALAAKFPGRVMLVAYDDKDRPQADALRVDLDRQMVTVNRTEALDAMMDSLRNLINLPLRTPPAGYVEQLKAPKRRTEVDEEKGKVRRFYISTGPDDYAHAEVYDLVASELLGILGVAEQAQAAEGPVEPEEDLGVRPRGLYDYDPGFGEV